MAAKKISNARRAVGRSLGTDEVVARRAVDMVNSKAARRRAHAEYKDACERFKARCGIDYLDVNDPKFRRGTKKAYEAFQEARAGERNAMRRLETAVRNCPASTLNEPAKAQAATQSKGTLADNIALIESCCRMLNLSPSGRLALLSKMASRDFLSCATIAAAARLSQGGAE